MTVETEVANLTTAVDNLAEAVNVKKATLDASVADAESARDAAAASATTASGHATSAAASAAAAASTASGIAGFDLDAIAATKAVTAVDVFVYDTSKDSDGGAWRKRTQHTSWYNETLNTATRGSRREFPAVAVIVAESDKVTIYDGDDPALPMWMVFNASTANNSFNVTAIFGHSGAPISSVSAFNGEIVVGCSAVTSNLGVRAANFISDSAWYKRQSNDMVWLLTLADRNINDVSIKWVSIGSQDIVNNSINDVAMTVLPDAPIDPATGLPVPTIAVATAGGVSVIKDDGTVVNASDTTAVSKIAFDNQRNLYTSRSGSVCTFYSSYLTSSFSGLQFYNYAPSPQTLVINGYPFLSGFDGGFARAGTSSTGVSTVAMNAATPAKGMVAYTTSSYNTGWMNGDIKGAFLADTDDTDLVGSGELVTNGEDWTGATGNTPPNGWTKAGNLTQYTITGGGGLQIDRNGEGGTNTSQTITTVVGKRYVFSLDVVSNGGGSVFVEYTGGSSILNGTGPKSLSFTATTTATVIGVRAGTSTTQVIEIDNFSVKLADADRSVNNKGLVVSGSITRSPVATGAELVAYSGFSASNYLEQPYNSDLDFGTGDFSVMGWFNRTADGYLVDTIDAALTEGFAVFSSAGSLYFRTRNGSNTQAISSALTNNVWTHFAAVRTQSGALHSIYLNGELNASVSGVARSIGGTDSPLRVGNYNAGSSPFGGSLALIRISATAPTAQQIARIYQDERPLFQENAACTIAGTSDAVTALAFDDSTNLLHVGSSYGRSVFQGLRRVSNTTTAVGTAISAANGLIAEE